MNTKEKINWIKDNNPFVKITGEITSIKKIKNLKI